MSISSRIHDTLESWQAEWKDRLRGWMVKWTAEGLEKLMDDLEPITRDQVRTTLTQIRDMPETPPEYKKIIQEALELKSYGMLIMILVSLGAMIFGMVTAQATPTLSGIRYAASRLAKMYRLDPIAVITAWRRDKPTYEKFFGDLKDQGWSDDRIEALKFFTLFYPAPADLIRWQAREVFEPEMIARYGLDSEFEAIEKEPFYKAGMTDEQILNFWRAHWEHASWMQVVEMLHRGLLTEEQVWDWFRVVEIPPFWRQMLIASAYTWPTRVDVRRWWDMRTIDETELRRLYSGMGYRGVNLDNYVLWTKVYVAFPDLMARWSKGWITIDEVRAQLTGMGMPATRLEEFIQMKVKAEQPERTAKERDVTKTDIIKGVKQGIITRDEGVELLSDMGYDEDEAVYILEINIPLDDEDAVVRQRELSKTDIIKGLKTEVITEDEALDRLIELRYSRADSEFLIAIFKATIKPPTEPREREASKADIVLAVKKGLITPEDAYLMLQDIGFTPEASAFILMVKAETSPFSPISYTEFKDLTYKYRLAAGKEAKPMPEELKKAADEVVKLTEDLEILKESIEAEEKKLIEEEVLPEAATAKRDELRVTLHRAAAELARVKDEYDQLLAQWRHGR